MLWRNELISHKRPFSTYRINICVFQTYALKINKAGELLASHLTPGLQQSSASLRDDLVCFAAKLSVAEKYIFVCIKELCWRSSVSLRKATFSLTALCCSNLSYMMQGPLWSAEELICTRRGLPRILEEGSVLECTLLKVLLSHSEGLQLQKISDSSERQQQIRLSGMQKSGKSLPIQDSKLTALSLIILGCVCSFTGGETSQMLCHMVKTAELHW